MYNNNSVAKPAARLHVAELARKANVTPATVRYYARIGMLSPDREPENGYRCFVAEDVHRVVFIRQAQALGLTIGDIKEILRTVDHGEVPCGQVKSLVEERLLSIQRDISRLRATEIRMKQAIGLWTRMGDPVPHDGELCPLIERVDTPSNISLQRSTRSKARILERTADVEPA
jgi:MerR family transcriptional regulator, Zn(II)-responsive regulator of zntA